MPQPPIDVVAEHRYSTLMAKATEGPRDGSTLAGLLYRREVQVASSQSLWDDARRPEVRRLAQEQGQRGGWGEQRLIVTDRKGGGDFRHFDPPIDY